MQICGACQMLEAVQYQPQIQAQRPAEPVVDNPNQADAAKQGEMALKLILASLTGKGLRLDKSV